MRLLTFTLLVIAVAVGIQLGVSHLPYGMQHVIDKFTLVLMLVLPIIATAGIAYAMRISNLGYVIFLSILSPFVSFAILAFIAVTFFHDHLL
jgi:hypothetical protein